MKGDVPTAAAGATWAGVAAAAAAAAVEVGAAPDPPARAEGVGPEEAAASLACEGAGGGGTGREGDGPIPAASPEAIAGAAVRVRAAAGAAVSFFTIASQSRASAAVENAKAKWPSLVSGCPAEAPDRKAPATILPPENWRVDDEKAKATWIREFRRMRPRNSPPLPRPIASVAWLVPERSHFPAITRWLRVPLAAHDLLVTLWSILDSPDWRREPIVTL